MREPRQVLRDHYPDTVFYFEAADIIARTPTVRSAIRNRHTGQLTA
jgi:hypothetical protein